MSAVQTESKLGLLFSEAVEQSGLAACGVEILDAAVSRDESEIAVIVALPDLTDWNLREQVLTLAGSFDGEYGTLVRCAFTSR